MSQRVFFVYSINHNHIITFISNVYLKSWNAQMLKTHLKLIVSAMYLLDWQQQRSTIVQLPSVSRLSFETRKTKILYLYKLHKQKILSWTCAEDTWSWWAQTRKLSLPSYKKSSYWVSSVLVHFFLLNQKSC